MDDLLKCWAQNGVLEVLGRRDIFDSFVNGSMPNLY